MNASTDPVTRNRFILAVAWLFIAIKCILVVWAIERWQVPVHPGWIVYPTLLFAALATGLWLGHKEGD